MIRGCFYHDGQESPRLAVSVLSERCSVHQHRPSHDLKQLFARETMSSASIGSNNTRAVYCSHMVSCSGINCACHNAASHFLSRVDEDNLDQYISNNRAYLEENIKFPYMLILAQDSEFIVVSALASRDFQASRLDPGLYDIRYLNDRQTTLLIFFHSNSRGFSSFCRLEIASYHMWLPRRTRRCLSSTSIG